MECFDEFDRAEIDGEHRNEKEGVAGKGDRKCEANWMLAMRGVAVKWLSLADW